jgi:SAM-dependent methyltransferase
MFFRTVEPIEKYRRHAKRNELQHLAGRHERHTAFVNRELLSTLKVAPGSSVLDVGCGSGALLRDLADRIGEGIGTVPTEEERLLLDQSPHPGNVSFCTCLSIALPFADGRFDVVILNGVLLLLRNLDEAAKTIAELARVTRPGGTVWIGEALLRPPRRRSRVAKFVRNVGKVIAGKRIPVMRRSMVTTSHWIRSCAAAQGLHLVLEKQHLVLDREGLHLTSDQSRRDFMFSRTV